VNNFSSIEDLGKGLEWHLKSTTSNFFAQC